MGVSGELIWVDEGGRVNILRCWVGGGWVNILGAWGSG